MTILRLYNKYSALYTFLMSNKNEKLKIDPLDKILYTSITAKRNEDERKKYKDTFKLIDKSVDQLETFVPK